ncbi:ATP-binding protein [Streptomyces ovatisporus]|uniref:ATP-binding protein n=1 Tax=Streptomyces ovatisporus TaxID=1128682 RepID=A0ABV8ZXV4_9ACTN
MHVTSNPFPAATSEEAPLPEDDGAARPSPATVTRLRLSAFRALRERTVPLTPVTLLTGGSGSGKSSVLEAYEALARLGGGEALGEVFGRGAGGATAYVPHSARPDAQGRRGFQLGCTVDGPAGAVRLDLAVQAEPALRVVGERLTASDGRTLLSTALRDPARPAVQAEWHSAGPGRVTRARLPDDRLATALLPLRVAGGSKEERRVLAAAEQVVVALRSAFACDPRPENMRDPVSAADKLLRGGCDNLAAVLRRTRMECGTRHGLLVAAVRAGCAGPVADLASDVVDDGRDRGMMRALLVRGADDARTPLEWLGDGELRYTALALVLLTGPGVLSMDPAQEVLPARQALTVLADGLDRALDGRQTRELLSLAVRMGERGHVRLLGAVSDAGAAAREAESSPGVGLVDLGT